MKSLASAPGMSTQHQVPPAERKLTGIRTTTIRVSVGMEHFQDICDDLDQALCIATAGKELLSTAGDESHHQPALDLSKLSLQHLNSELMDDVIPSGKSHSSSIAEKSVQLKALYDQMSAIANEVEILQQQIKEETNAVLKQQY